MNKRQLKTTVLRLSPLCALMSSALLLSDQTAPGWPPALNLKLPHPGHRLVLLSRYRWPPPCANPSANSSKPNCV